MNILNSVIIFGGDHHNTLGVIRSLGEKNIYPVLVLIKSPNNFIASSRYIRKLYLVNNEVEGVSILMNELTDKQLKPIVICTNDKTASVVDKYYSKLSNYFLLPNAGEEGRINFYMNKEEMRSLALSCGMTVPKTWFLKKNDEIPLDIIYPCITKTVCSIDGGKSDICVCSNQIELHKVLMREKDFQVQEYIDKDYELNIVGCSLKHGEQIIMPGIIRKIREYPYRKGSSSFSVLESFDDKGVNIELVKKFIREIRYDGLFSIEFVSKNGINYFLEVNLRNDGNGYIPTSAGVNLPFIWCCSLINIQPSIGNAKLPFYFMSDFTDFRHILSKHVTFKKWWSDFRRVNCFLLYNRNDKKPFIKRLRYLIKDIIISKFCKISKRR